MPRRVRVEFECEFEGVRAKTAGPPERSRCSVVLASNAADDPRSTSGSRALRPQNGATPVTRSDRPVEEDGVNDASARLAPIRRALGSVIEGKEEVIELLLVGVLAEGHVLVEDVPGVGKTTLAKALARAFATTFTRIQFTPDSSCPPTSWARRF